MFSQIRWVRCISVNCTLIQWLQWFNYSSLTHQWWNWAMHLYSILCLTDGQRNLMHIFRLRSILCVRCSCQSNIKHHKTFISIVIVLLKKFWWKTFPWMTLFVLRNHYKVQLLVHKSIELCLSTFQCFDVSFSELRAHKCVNHWVYGAASCSCHWNNTADEVRQAFVMT